MVSPNSAQPVRSRLRRLRRWSFQILVVMSVLWGMFSAAVVFAVRYDLLPDAGVDLGVARRPVSLDEARDWPVVRVSDWRQVIAPESALVIAESDTELRSLLSQMGQHPDLMLRQMDFHWNAEDGRGVWVAHVGRPTCECPFESADRWNYMQALIDPLTGKLFGRAMLKAITTEELQAQFGVRH